MTEEEESETAEAAIEDELGMARNSVVEAENLLLIVLGAERADDGVARTDVIDPLSHLLSGKMF